MQLLDPVLGGKIRQVIVTIFAILVAGADIFSYEGQTWYEWASKIYAFTLVVIQYLTHRTDLGNVN